MPPASKLEGGDDRRFVGHVEGTRARPVAPARHARRGRPAGPVRPFRTTGAPAAAKPSAKARPSPREEPVTSAVRPVRSKSRRIIRLRCDGWLRSVRSKTPGSSSMPRPGPLHRIDVAVLDLRHLGHQFLVPAGVEGAHRFLDQRVGLAERGSGRRRQSRPGRCSRAARRGGGRCRPGRRSCGPRSGRRSSTGRPSRRAWRRGLSISLIGKARTQGLAGADPIQGRARVLGQRLGDSCGSGPRTRVARRAPARGRCAWRSAGPTGSGSPP